jgi:hypothetical protein
MPPKTKTAIAKMALKRQITGKPPRLFKEMNEYQRVDPKLEKATDAYWGATFEYAGLRHVARQEGGDHTGALENAYGKKSHWHAVMNDTQQRRDDLEDSIRSQVTNIPAHLDGELDSYNTGMVWDDWIDKDVWSVK